MIKEVSIIYKNEVKTTQYLTKDWIEKLRNTYECKYHI